MELLIGWRDWETEFLGDIVKCQLKPLDRGQMLMVLPLLNAAAAAKENKDITPIYNLQEKAKDIFPERVRILSGITIGGEIPTPEQMADIPQLATLACEILSELVTISSEGGKKKKQSKSPSEDMKVEEPT